MSRKLEDSIYQAVHNNHGCFFSYTCEQKEVRERQEKDAQVGERRIREGGMLWITYALKVKERSKKTRMCVDVGK